MSVNGLNAVDKPGVVQASTTIGHAVPQSSEGALLLLQLSDPVEDLLTLPHPALDLATGGMTVVWSRAPNSLPMSGNERPRSG